MKSEPEAAKVLNNFFSNIVKNLIILEYENLNSNIENIKDRVFKTFILELSNVDIFAVLLCKKGNYAIKTSNSPNIFKSVDITSLHQKYRKNNKGNYRLVRKI